MHLCLSAKLIGLYASLLKKLFGKIIDLNLKLKVLYLQQQKTTQKLLTFFSVSVSKTI